MSSTAVNVPVSTNSIQLNPHDYINKGINEIITEYLSLISPDKKRSMKTLFFGVTILISADIAKNIIQNFIKENSQNINLFLTDTFKLISFENLYNISIRTKSAIQSKYYAFKSLFRKREDISSYNNSLLTIDTTERVELNLSYVLIKKLITVLEDNNNENLKISYDSNYEYNLTYFDESSNKLIYGKSMDNINIEYNKLNIEIDKISFTSNYHTIKTKDTTKLLDILSKEYTHFKNSGFYSTQLIDLSLNMLLYKSITDNSYYVNAYIPNMKHNIKFRINGSPSSYADVILSKAFEGYTYESFLKHYSLNTKLMNIILTNVAVLFVIEQLTIEKNTNEYKESMRRILQNSEYDMNYRYLHSFSKESFLSNFIGNEHFYNGLWFTVSKTFETFELYKSIVNYNDNNLTINKKAEASSDKNYLNLILNVSLNDVTTNNKLIIYTKLDDFFNYINGVSKRITNGDKINIYTLNIDTITTIQKSDNEEYTKYIETKKSLVDEKKSLEDIIKLIGVEPPKHIETTKTTKEVKTNLINNKYCSFENLYLRRGQDIHLYNIVESFQNDKSLMTDLGIPNKLGILLHGEPGCGKTTTIITIASFFKRDIFYINLKAIKTNEELKMAFDYANSKHADGGVIVIEDIDAMSDIVHVRTAQSTQSQTKSQSINAILDSTESDITLEYLLNLLDGTLTYDNSIVILTTNHVKNLDPALYRAGRMDNLIEMKKCDHYQISKIYKRFIQKDIDKNILNKIPEDKYTPAEIIFHLKLWVKRRNEQDNIIMQEFMKK